MAKRDSETEGKRKEGGREGCMHAGREGGRECERKRKRATTEGSKVDERMGDQICEPEEVEAA